MQTETMTRPEDTTPRAPKVVALSELPPAIACALVQAQRFGKAVAKAARNTAHGFDYAAMEDLIDAGRDALNQAGLAVIPGDQDVTRFDVGAKDRPVTNYDVTKTWRVVHESGAIYNVLVVWPLYLQSGKRPRDKAVSAADTTMLGYLMRDLLCIPRLTQDQVDLRDDRGTSEPAQVGASSKPKPSSSKPDATRPSSKPAASKPATKPAAAKPSSSKPKAETKAPPAKAETKPAAKKKAPAKKKAASSKKKKAPAKKNAEAEAEAAEERAAIQEADAQGETAAAKPTKGTGQGGTTKRGETDLGQTYGAKADEVAAAQAGELTDDERDAEVGRALAMGITPSTTNDALIVELPTDPTADDLEGAGWPADLAAELEGYDESGPVTRDAVNGVTRAACELLGMKMSAAKKVFVPAFEGVGVDLKNKGKPNSIPNGYQLRLWAIAITAALSEAVA